MQWVAAGAVVSVLSSNYVLIDSNTSSNNNDGAYSRGSRGSRGRGSCGNRGSGWSGWKRH